MQGQCSSNQLSLHFSTPKDISTYVRMLTLENRAIIYTTIELTMFDLQLVSVSLGKWRQ